MKWKHIATASLIVLLARPAVAADYVIDTRGAHASVGFRFKHLDFSWLTGRFNKFDGVFTWDPDNPGASSVEVNIDVRSIDTNHAERDKHMRSANYLDTETYPTARFVSTRVEPAADGGATVHGQLTLHGVTRDIAISASRIGEGKDPWGGYRAGFEGTVTVNTRDFGFALPPSSRVEMFLYLEGVRR